MADKAIELALIKKALEKSPVKGVPIDIALSEFEWVWTLVLRNSDLAGFSVEERTRLIVFLYAMTKELYNEHKVVVSIVRLTE